MATVDCDRVCRNDFDDSETGYSDPRAVADTEHSDVARAEFDAEFVAEPAPDARGASLAKQTPLHRIAEVRRRQGVTLRNVARRLGMSLPVVRHQELPECDLRLSDLHRWQQVLEVPVAELLVEGDDQLSGPVLERSRMVKLMKTAAAIRERTEGQPVSQMVTMLIDQILEIMPELSDVTPWHAGGQRRTLDDVGRTGRLTIAEDVFRRDLGS